MERKSFGFVSIFVASIASLVNATAIEDKATFLVDVCHGKDEYLENSISVPTAILQSNSSTIVKFRLNEKRLECNYGTNTIIWSNPDENKTSTSAANPDIKISSFGYLKNNNEVYQKGLFCVTDIEANHWKFEVCNRVCNKQSSCIPKCCDPESVWDISRFPSIKCRPAGSILWKPRLYSDTKNKVSDIELQKLQININSSHPRNWCKSSPIIVSLRDFGSHKRRLFRILKDGSILKRIDRKKWEPLVLGTYCVDGTQNFSGDSLPYTGDENDDIVISCYKISKEKQDNRKSQRNVSLLYGIALIICSIFLLITLLVHILQWEKHSVHIWTQVIYITCLFITYVLLASNHFTSMTIVRTDDDNSSTAIMCRAIAILSHWFFLSTFCWLSVTCFDVYMTFRELKPTASKSRGLKKLMYYAVFAFSVPCIIVTIGIVFDYMYRYDIESDVIVPEYGGVTCWLDLKYAVLLYFYVPIGTLLGVNVIFFALTIRSLYLIQKSTKFATSSSSKTEKHHQSLILFAKLFLVMGIPWIFEVISFFTLEDYDRIPWYTVISDIMVICQALAIFGIFVMKRETLRSLGTKYPKLKRFNENYITMSTDRKTFVRKNHPILYWCIMCVCCSNWNISKSIGSFSKSNSAQTYSSSAGGDTSTHANHQTTASKINSDKSREQEGGNKPEEIELK